ncbi:MAG TPA: methyltransferase domain-containing protein, partial [Thermoleophilia bacterium]|nr:methyltransferase domain-containing protein [Thermoleophilia bacterium]
MEESTHTTERPPDPREVSDFAFRVWSYKQGEMVSLLIHLGDRLGLYRELDGAGSLTAEELADRTGLHPRWLREWLRGNAAAELLASEDGENFALTEAGAMVLAREEDSLQFAAGAFSAPPEPGFVDDLADAFRTGTGMPYDRHGAAGVHRTERMLGPWARLSLVPTIVPALDGVGGRLAAGALVADVGCGAGVALTTLAKAYPASTFHGYELSSLAVERARARVSEAGLSNVEILHRRAEELPPGSGYSLVLTFDCLHDMTRPDAAAAAIRGAIDGDGTWLVKEVRCDDTWAGNRRNPMLAMFLGFSVSSCMSSALSEPGGAGLGTIGLPPKATERLAHEAGFTRFRLHDFEDPA